MCLIYIQYAPTYRSIPFAKWHSPRPQKLLVTGFTLCVCVCACSEDVTSFNLPDSVLPNPLNRSSINIYDFTFCLKSVFMCFLQNRLLPLFLVLEAHPELGGTIFLRNISAFSSLQNVTSHTRDKSSLSQLNISLHFQVEFYPMV